MMAPQLRLLISLGLMLAFGIAAFVLPKYAVGDGRGLAAAGTAALTFLSFALFSLLASAYAFFVAWRHRAVLPTRLRVLGLVPFPGLLVLVAVFWLRVLNKPGSQQVPAPNDSRGQLTLPTDAGPKPNIGD